MPLERLGSRFAGSRWRWTRCAARRRRRRVEVLSGGEKRRVALCRLLLQEAGHPAARRADQPSRRRIGRVARTSPAEVRRHGHRRHPRSLLSRQRRRLDSGTRSRPGHSVGRELLVLARAEAGAPAAGREDRERAAEDAASASSNGFACRPKAVTPKARRASTPTRRCSHRRPRNAREDLEIYIPPGPRLGEVVIEADKVEQGLRRQAACRRHELSPAAGRHRRRHRPERRGQDDAVSHDHRPGNSPTRHDSDGRDREAGLRRSEPRRLDPDKTDLGRDLRRAGLRRARQARGELARLCRAIQFLRHRSAEEGRHCCPAASAIACIWRRC